jgi:serine/threonine protein phosphatase PrpC
MRTPRLTTIKCSRCGEDSPSHTSHCQVCGAGLDPASASDPSLSYREITNISPDGRLRDYKLLRYLSSYGDLRGFLGVRQDEDGTRTPVVIRVRVTPPAARNRNRPVDLLRPPSPGVAADTVRLSGANFGADLLHAEYDILSHANHPALPEVLDYFEEHGVSTLVETAAIGDPLGVMWNAPGVTPAQRYEWLEQIRQLLAELHRRDVVFPSMAPNRFVVSPDGYIKVRDVGGLAKLPLARAEHVWHSLSPAPDIARRPRAPDLRADVYNFGALIYALFLGRDLQNSDFLEPGTPKPFGEQFPEAVPPLVRLVRKTMAGDLAHRFPTAVGKVKDKSGLEDVRLALGEYARVADSIRYDIAGWSNTGLQRDNNEDCFTISSLCAGAGDNRRDFAMVCLADGMGGLDSGEVASSVAVSTVADFLRERGLTSGALDKFGEGHPFHEVRRMSTVLEESVHEANRVVYELALNSGSTTGMGCTLEAILLCGRNVVVQHVGDSRVYHKSGGDIKQITVDQTLVNRLLQSGEITPEEAEQHPYRSAVVQAIGAQPVVHPACHQFQMAPGDWLVVCSDGISNHVPITDLSTVLHRCSNAEQAARRLVNLANMRGGFDNGTVVVIAAR